MASDPFPDKRRCTWRMKYKPDPAGPWITVTLGKDPRLAADKPPKSPPMAIQDRARELADIEYRAKMGLVAAPARAKSLAVYLEDYAIARKATLKPGSHRQLVKAIDRFRDFVTERKVTTVQGLDRPLCRDYLEWRITQVSHDTLKTEMRYLSPIWSRAIEDKLVLANPWSRLKVPGKSTRSEPTYWTPEEVARIADHASKSWHSDLILVLANTGLRISTALAMRWRWIDWPTGVIRVPAEAAAHEPGVKTAYALALNGLARTILQRRHFAARSEDSLVFPNPLKAGKPVPYDSARDAIERAILRSGVPKGTPHDLRHTYARLLSKHAPANVVQSQLGHSAAATTQIYTRLSAEQVAVELEGFSVGEHRGKSS